MKLFFAFLLMPLWFCLAAEPPGGVCKTTLKAGLHGVVRDSAGKIIRRTSLGKDPVILDTNIVISLVQSKYSPAAPEYRKKWAGRLNHMMKKKGHTGEDAHLYIAEKSAKERFVGNPDEDVTFPTGTRIFEIDGSRTSAEYQSVVKKLESLSVGQVKANSGNDREIVADLFFAKKNYPQDVPTFVTGDGGIYGPLCQLNPMCLRLNGDRKLIRETFPDGFEVSIEAGGRVRTVRIVPF